jgi:hypothetical protein
MVTNPFLQPSLKFDMSKLPEELRWVLPSAFVLVLRAGFDLALEKTRRHDVAIEVTYQALYHLTTDQRWDPKAGPLRDHFLRLTLSSASWLRYGSKPEKAACAFFAHEQGKHSPSPEDIAIFLESQGELDLADETRSAMAETVRARLAEHPLATAIIGVWQAEGNVPPRELGRKLGASRRAVYSAIDLIRYHAAQCRKTRKNQGEA